MTCLAGLIIFALPCLALHCILAATYRERSEKREQAQDKVGTEETGCMAHQCDSILAP